MNALIKAGNKFKARPQTYLMIPIIAACVGWITNWMAVQMIFYPTNFIGIPFYRVPEVPLGFIGWQGIVPCKTRKMSEVRYIFPFLSILHAFYSKLLYVCQSTYLLFLRRW